MQRRWGYIFVLAAMVVGAVALLIPLPESIVPVEMKVSEPSGKPGRKAPSKQAAKAKTPRAKAKAAEVKKPPVKTFPMQDTTKSRVLVKPKPKG